MAAAREKPYYLRNGLAIMFNETAQWCWKCLTGTRDQPQFRLKCKATRSRLQALRA